MHSYNNENKKGKGKQLVSCNGAFALINSFYLFDIDTLTYNILDVNTVFKKNAEIGFFSPQKSFLRIFFTIFSQLSVKAVFLCIFLIIYRSVFLY